MNTNLFNYRVEFQARGQDIFTGFLGLILIKKLPNGLDNKIIKDAFNKFRHDDNLSTEEEMNVIKVIDTFVTCSSDKDEAKKLLIRECGDKYAVAGKAVDIAKTVNKHKHNRTCRKYNTKCRFSYPKYPSSRTIITQSPEIFYKNELNNFQDDLEAHDKWL